MEVGSLRDRLLLFRPSLRATPLSTKLLATKHNTVLVLSTWLERWLLPWDVGIPPIDPMVFLLKSG